MPSSTVSDSRIYELLRQVPEGRVTTYKDIAEALGTKAYQRVGQAVKHNPDPEKNPCHRVVKADGRIGGYRGATAGAAVQEKIRKLREEGVEIREGRVVDFDQRRFTSFASPA